MKLDSRLCLAPAIAFVLMTSAFSPRLSVGQGNTGRGTKGEKARAGCSIRHALDDESMISPTISMIFATASDPSFSTSTT